MVSRTLLFNPTDKQKEAYQLAFDAQNHLIEKLRPGALIKEAFTSTLNLIKDKDASLADKIHTNFGFGIGCKYKEDELSINAENSNKIEPGMVFHVRITFRDVQKPASKGVIAIGDTVLVGQDENEILTNAVPRKYAQISYTLDDDDEEEESEEEFGAEKPKAKSAKQENGLDNGNGIINSRTRGGTKQQDNKQFEENLRKDQDNLLTEKLEELKRRYAKNEIEMDSKKQKQKDMGKI